MITVRPTLALLTLLGVALAAAPTSAADPPKGPNIVLILSDDMGFSDLGCFGGEIHTPNLDRLAANGLRFTQFYNTARCCPTRASLLTGLYPHQAGVGHMMNDNGEKFPGYRGDLNRSCVTLAEALKPAGYRAYALGKWHVTRHNGPNGPKDNWPLQRGFDRYYGTIHGAGSFFDPSTLTRDNTAISPAPTASSASESRPAVHSAMSGPSPRLPPPSTTSAPIHQIPNSTAAVCQCAGSSTATRAAGPAASSSRSRLPVLAAQLARVTVDSSMRSPVASS